MIKKVNYEPQTRYERVFVDSYSFWKDGKKPLKDFLEYFQQFSQNAVVELEYDYDNGYTGGFEVSWTRLETSEETAIRVKNEEDAIQAEKDRVKALKRINEERDRKEYERLKKKFEK